MVTSQGTGPAGEVPMQTHEALIPQVCQSAHVLRIGAPPGPAAGPDHAWS